MKKLVCVDFQKKKKRKEEKKKSLVCVDWEKEKAKETIGSLIPMKAFSLRKKKKNAAHQKTDMCFTSSNHIKNIFPEAAC